MNDNIIPFGHENSNFTPVVKSSLGYLIKTVEVAHEAHDKAMEDHFVKLDDSYQKFYDKNRELRKKIAELPPIEFPTIPYVNTDGLQRLFDMAEKLSTLLSLKTKH